MNVTQPREQRKRSRKKAGTSSDLAPESVKTQEEPKQVEKSPEEIQNLVNLLIWKEGSNVQNFPDYKERLEKYLLTPEQVTVGRLKIADRYIRDAILDKMKEKEITALSDSLFPKPPTIALDTLNHEYGENVKEEEKPLSSASPDTGNTVRKLKLGTVFLSDLKSGDRFLVDALDEEGKWFKRKGKLISVIGQSEAEVKVRGSTKTERWSVHTEVYPMGDSESPEQEEQEMATATAEPKAAKGSKKFSVSAKDGVSLCKAMGLPEKKYKGERLAVTLNNMKLHSDSVEEKVKAGEPTPELSAKDVVTLRETLTALEAGKTIVVGKFSPEKTETPKTESNGESSAVPKKRGRPAKTESNGKTPHKEKKKSTRQSATILSYSATAVLRWAGWNKFTKEDALKLLNYYKITSLAESTVQTALTDGKREDEKWGKRAPVTKTEAKELLAFRSSPKKKAEEVEK